MKRRYLKKPIEKVLTLIAIIITIFFGMLDDFELRAIPLLLALLIIDGLCIYLVSTYGRGLIYEKEVK